MLPFASAAILCGVLNSPGLLPRLPQDLIRSEVALAIENLNPAVAAVRHIDVTLRIGRDIVRGVELPGLVAAITPGLDPIAVLVGLCDAGIDVAVADKNIPLRVKGDVSWLPEAAVLGGQWRDRMIQWSGFFVGGFLFASEKIG